LKEANAKLASKTRLLESFYSKYQHEFDPNVKGYRIDNSRYIKRNNRTLYNLKKISEYVIICIDIANQKMELI
jgi:hypothetical protein